MTLDINKEEMIDALRDSLMPVVKDFVDSVVDDAKGAAKDYGKDVASDFAVTLWMSRHGDNEMAERNLKHLKVQLKQLAMIQQLKINANIMAMLEKSLEVAWRVGLKLLLA